MAVNDKLSTTSLISQITNWVRNLVVQKIEDSCLIVEENSDPASLFE